MKFMLRFCFLFMSCFFMMFLNEVKANTKEEMPYEITSIVAGQKGFEIKGWGLMANTQHFIDKNTHEYQILLHDNGNIQSYIADQSAIDQSDLMRMEGTRKCGINEMNQISDNCWYDYKNVGFKVLIPYDNLEMNKEYRVSLSINAKTSNRKKQIDLYYPTAIPATHIKDEFEYRAISALEDTTLQLSYYDVFVRPIAGDKNKYYTTTNVCSYAYGNKLYYKSKSIFRNIFEKKVVNETTFYRVGAKEADCERNHRVVNEGSAITPAWIPSSFVDYGGKPLVIKTTINNHPPQLKIHQHPNITLKNVSTFDPFQYVSATDKEEGDLTNKIKLVNGEVKKVVGTYPLTFKVSDKYGASDTKIMNVTVQEDPNTPPWIEAFDQTIYQYDPFDYFKGVKAYDQEDGNLTSKLTYKGIVDTTKTGTYEVDYQVYDSKKVKANKKIKVTVIKNPREKIRYVDRNYLWYEQEIPLNWIDKYQILLDQLKTNHDYITISIEE